ncbi:hypothetical protein V8G54_003918 [Vigna mungo]|uniref:Protein kinase domain-containing protein n=1 Tax=Vigna mungo TaxID=3915 RepID=A0AAQ3SAK4_VIGMU
MAQERRFVSLCDPALILHLSLSMLGSAYTENDDDAIEEDDDFVFDIDPTVLVDTRKLIIDEPIAEGLHSIVYKGWYELNPVSIKVMLPMQTSNVPSSCKAKFQREFIGASVEPTMMIITELFEGCSLHKYLESIYPNALSLEQSISFALDISQAMEYLHANGIIHRDLKPGNLLVPKDKMQILLTNFETAREEISGEMTSEAGTYRYMAPELFSKDPLSKGAKKCYDHKVDVHSFAMVLWAIVKNQIPFKGRSDLLAAYATAKKMRPSLEGFPEVLLPLLQSCWEEDPKLRPEFSEITQILEKLLHDYHSTGISADEEKVCPTTSVQELIPNYVDQDNSEHQNEAQNLNTSVCLEGQSEVITQNSSPVLAQTKHKRTLKKCKGLWLCFRKCFHNC